MTQTTPRFLSFFYCLCLFFSGFTSLSAQSDFTEFPWLNDLVDTEDCCQNQKITAYQSGIFTFVYIEKGTDCSVTGGTLYFQDGTFYCMDALGLDCRAAYGLTEDNARLLYDCAKEEEVDETYIACAGKPLFLPAIQTFPQPPQGPAGPNGEIPPAPCLPLLNEIKITPSEGAVAMGLTGFTIFPSENGIYEVTSSGICGGPGSSNSDEITVRYQVLLDEECGAVVDCEKVLEQEWIAPFLSEKCTGKIYEIEYEGAAAIYITTLCGCVDAADALYTCGGDLICSVGGNFDPNGDGICDETVREQIIDDNAIWKPECDCPCPVDFTPVCGADGQTYESACEAICAGVEVVDNAACTESVCLSLANLNINENFCNSCFSEVSIYSYEGADYLVTRENSPLCADGITAVTNCDSTVAFCLEGGIAGFDQCGEFFKSAVLVETVWSRLKDCNNKPITIAEPCTDLAEVDFGLCLAVMGVGVVDGKCQTISGCLNFEINGVNYSKAFFPTVEICQQTCKVNGGEDNNLDLFNTYPWLAEIVDPKNCRNTTIEVYSLGSFSYLHIMTEEGGALYYEDGTFYCMDLPNYDCRALYGLTQDLISQTYTCENNFSNAIGSSRFTTPNNSSKLTATLQAFPNPTNGLVQVRLPNTATSSIRVFDSYGRLVQEMEVEAAATTVDLSAEVAGIYLVEWQSEGRREMLKLIKQ